MELIDIREHFERRSRDIMRNDRFLWKLSFRRIVDLKEDSRRVERNFESSSL